MIGDPSLASETDAKRTSALRADFERATHHPPEGVWAAPGRVNLIGEHTDYNDGFVLPIAIEQSAYVAVRRRDDRHLLLWSRQVGSTELELDQVRAGFPRGWAAYVAGVFWSLEREGVPVPGFDLLLDSDVPLGSGLSSSAAIECAALLAAADLTGSALDRATLALVAQRAENQIAQVPCGVMDQMASLAGECGHALFLDCRSLECRSVPLALEKERALLLVVDTRARHRLVTGEYAARRTACEQAAALLGVRALRDATPEQVESSRAELGPERFRRARHVVSENARVLAAVTRLEAGDVTGVAPLLTASHRSLRDDFEVTVPELDVAVEALLEARALGARMIGGGFGGSVLALVREADLEGARAAVTAAFRKHRFTEPAFFTAVASRGARRVG